jgi:chromosome segregation ATPase
MGEHQEPHMPCDTGDFSRDGVLQAAQAQIDGLKVELAAMQKDRDWYKEHCDRMSREQGTIISAELACENMRKARDAALMKLSQVRAELEHMRAVNAELVADHVAVENEITEERDKANARAEAAEAENARLLRNAGTATASEIEVRTAYGRAVAALHRAKDHVWLPMDIDRGLEAEIDALLSDATATQAADAWRAQQEEIRREAHLLGIRDCIHSAKGWLEDGYGEGTVRDVIRSLEELARRAGGKDSGQ